MDILEELKKRDERIETLEKALLFLMALHAGASPHGASAQDILRDISPTFKKDRVDKILNEYKTSEKALKEFIDICENIPSSGR